MFSKHETREKCKVMEAFIEGKTIECRSKYAGKWTECPGPIWDWVHFNYRVKPETPDEIDWVHIAPNFKFCARDEDGSVYVFVEKPYVPEGSDVWAGSGGAARLAKYWQGVFTQGDIPWNKSLLIRDRGE